MHKQHQWLLEKLDKLQAQQEAYDTRIRTTEVVAAAAEVATSSIRHMEQQLAAIEAVENEKVFENWAAAEINQLKTFRDDNRNVRQKQIELHEEVVGVSDNLDRVKHVSDDLESVLKRLEFLESREKEDAAHIRSMELEIVSLKSTPKPLNISTRRPTPKASRVRPASRPVTPPMLYDTIAADDSSETEDEFSMHAPRTNASHIQVPRSPEMEQR